MTIKYQTDMYRAYLSIGGYVDVSVADRDDQWQLKHYIEKGISCHLGRARVEVLVHHDSLDDIPPCLTEYIDMNSPEKRDVGLRRTAAGSHPSVPDNPIAFFGWADECGD